MRNFLKFIVMLPFVLGSMLMSMMLVGLSVAFDMLTEKR